MDRVRKGIIVMPTGAGKSFTMVADALEQLKFGPKTILVVAPRILLAKQLREDFMKFLPSNYVHICHVHTGESVYFSTTSPKKIALFNDVARGASESCVIFTTYNSLHKIVDSNIHIDTVYFDESHNSVKKNFFDSTRHLSANANRCYFFTATPKYSHTVSKPGMNNPEVYNQIIYNVPAPRLINDGSILPPKINAIRIPSDRLRGEEAAERDCMTLLDTLYNEEHMEKVLVAAPNTKVMLRMLAETDFMKEVQSMGYDLLWITSKHGAFLNGKKITREEFFSLIQEFGASPDKKFIVLHYSILSEGISVPGLTSLILMRQMNVIEMCQSVGRVIRLHLDDIKRIQEGTLIPGKLEDYTKSFGMVYVPVYSNVGIATVNRLQDVVDTVFVEGQPAVATITK